MLAKDLPIYNDTRTYATDYVRIFEKMPKLHRYHIGKNIYDMSLSLFEIIEHCNKSTDYKVKYSLMDEYGTLVDGILTRLRIAVDTRIICIKDYTKLCNHLVTLGKQANGLKNNFGRTIR